MEATNMGDRLHQRRSLIEDMRGILNLASEEGRPLTAEERQMYDRMEVEVDEITADHDRDVKLRQSEAVMKEVRDRPVMPPSEDAYEHGSPEVQKRHRDIFRRYLRSGDSSTAARELRDLSASIDTEGGYLVPDDFRMELIKFVDDETFFLDRATVIETSTGGTVKFPRLDADPDDADWTGETVSVTEDTSHAFGEIDLTPKYLSKSEQVSRYLVEGGAMDIEAHVRDRLAYKWAITIEKGFLTGLGTGNEPLGIFTASASGISTDRDVSDGNTTTAIGADNLFNVQYSLKSAYHGRAAWLFHRDAVRDIRKLKAEDNQYLWQPGLQTGQPDMILGSPVLMSEFVPNTFTTGLYVGAYADLTRYYIAMWKRMEIQRLDELAARTNQFEYILRSKITGAPVLEEAFARVTLA